MDLEVALYITTIVITLVAAVAAFLLLKFLDHEKRIQSVEDIHSTGIERLAQDFEKMEDKMDKMQSSLNDLKNNIHNQKNSETNLTNAIYLLVEKLS